MTIQTFLGEGTERILVALFVDLYEMSCTSNRQQTLREQNIIPLRTYNVVKITSVFMYKAYRVYTMKWKITIYNVSF